jgi:hypothetical protein
MYKDAPQVDKFKRLLIFPFFVKKRFQNSISAANGCNFLSLCCRPKIVLDVALATPAAILNLRLARENFARSRDESSFETASKKSTISLATKLRLNKLPSKCIALGTKAIKDLRKLIVLVILFTSFFA